MAGNPNGLSLIKKYSILPIERITYTPDANMQTIRSVNKGILFIMAFWSGPAIKSFSNLTAVLSQLPEITFEIVVADVDGSHELQELSYLKDRFMSGSGETLWIENGEVIHFASLANADGSKDSGDGLSNLVASWLGD